MPRKRTKGSSTNQEQPPSSESVVAPTEQPTATATLDTPAPEPPVAQPEPSFVARLTEERSGRSVTTVFNIAGDYEAGIRLSEDRRARQMVIKFDQKPSPAVLSHMKEAGFGWNNRDQSWRRTIVSDQPLQVRIEAERTYQEVREMIRHERGLGEGTEIPF